MGAEPSRTADAGQGERAVSERALEVWRIGDFVPWAVAWTGEQAFRLQPSHAFPGKIEMDQKSNPGIGRPVFAGVHVTRQRRSLHEHLCHVCGETTTADDRWIFPQASGAFVTLSDGSRGFGVHVSPTHRTCADRSLGQCPNLRREGVAPIQVPEEDQGRLIPRTDVPPGMEALRGQFAVGREIVWSCYRLYGEALTARVARKLGG